MDKYRTWTLTLLSIALLLVSVVLQQVVSDIDRNNILYYDTGFFSSVLAGTKKYLARECWIEADTYLHQGLRHPEGDDEHDHDHSHEFMDSHEEFKHHHEHMKPSSTSLFVPYNREDFSGIHHATDFDDKDILPWLRLTAYMDPSQTSAYASGGHWLAWRIGNPQEAIDFLDEGLRNNPGAPDILMELGLIYFDADGSLETRDTKAALDAFNRALKVENELDVTLGLLTYQAFCYEKLGDNESAVNSVDRKLSMMSDAGLGNSDRFRAAQSYREHLLDTTGE